MCDSGLLAPLNELLASILDRVNELRLNHASLRAREHVQRQVNEATALIGHIASTASFAGLRAFRSASPTAIATLGAAIFASHTKGQPLNPLDFPSIGALETFGSPQSVNIDTDALTFSCPGIENPSHTLNGTVRGSVAVFCFSDLYLASGSTILIIGHRPLALLSKFSAVISNATIYASPHSQSGSDYGTIAVCGGGAGGIGGAGPLGGGQGGGIGGGAGGTADGLFPSGGSFGGGLVLSNQNPGGPTYGNPLLRLEGGSGGGGAWTGSRTPDLGDMGGAGGGAIEIGALWFVEVRGYILVQGGNTSRGGAGSGGAVLIHARQVDLLGCDIYAKGGTSDQGSNGAGGRVAVQAMQYWSEPFLFLDGGGPGAMSGSFEYAQPAVPSTEEVDFGSVPAGTSRTLLVGVQNTGSGDSFVNGYFDIHANPVFTIGDGRVISGLGRGSTSAVPCTFSPIAEGFFSESVYAVTDAGETVIHIFGTGASTCESADIDGDGDVGTDADIEAFFRVLAGGHC